MDGRTRKHGELLVSIAGLENPLPNYIPNRPIPVIQQVRNILTQVVPPSQEEIEESQVDAPVKRGRGRPKGTTKAAKLARQQAEQQATQQATQQEQNPTNSSQS